MCVCLSEGADEGGGGSVCVCVCVCVCACVCVWQKRKMATEGVCARACVRERVRA